MNIVPTDVSPWHRLSQGEAQIPHPLTGNLPEFLSALTVRTPPIGIFFDIFIGEHSLEGPPSIIEVQNVLDQEPIGGKRGQEQFIDLLAYPLAYGNVVAGGRSGMASHNHTYLRQALLQVQPVSIKQLDELPAVHLRHACCGGDEPAHAGSGAARNPLIASASCHEKHACQDELREHSRLTILPVQPQQCHLWRESEVRQIGRDGLQGRGQFAAILPLAWASIGANPLSRGHLKCGGARADHLPTLAPSVAGRTDGIESASC